MKDPREIVARAIYEHRLYGREGGNLKLDKPEWVERGNSFIQDEVRDFADAALEALSYDSLTAELSSTKAECERLRAQVAELDSGLKYWRDNEQALREALVNWPKMPDSWTLGSVLSGISAFPEDWERGKRIQREVPDFIPYKTECEKGAGYWDRITGGQWRSCHPVLGATKGGSNA